MLSYELHLCPFSKARVGSSCFLSSRRFDVDGVVVVVVLQLVCCVGCSVATARVMELRVSLFHRWCYLQMCFHRLNQRRERVKAADSRLFFFPALLQTLSCACVCVCVGIFAPPVRRAAMMNGTGKKRLGLRQRSSAVQRKGGRKPVASYHCTKHLPSFLELFLFRRSLTLTQSLLPLRPSLFLCGFCLQRASRTVSNTSSMTRAGRGPKPVLRVNPDSCPLVTNTR